MAQEIATTAPKGPKTIRDLIESPQFGQAVKKALPEHLTADRFVRVALTALTRTPKLADCDKESFFQALMTLSQFGLEPDGRNAHLIPFRNNNKGITECQLLIDYKGLVDLAMRSGRISYIHADKICENDEFKYNKGLVEKHEVELKAPRGKAYAYYAIAKFKDGSEKAEAMTKDEVEAIRKRSRAKDNGPWVTDFDEMAKKTVFRRLSKWLQLSPEFRDALEADSDRIEDLRFEAATPIERPLIGGPGNGTGSGENHTVTTPAPTETPQTEAKTEAPKKTRRPRDVKKSAEAKEIEERLAKAKFTVPDLISLAIKMNFVEPPQGFGGTELELANIALDSFGPEKLKVFLEDWDTLVDLLKEEKHNE